MCDTKWGVWLYRITRERSTRGVANRVGVSHTTVRRWCERGIPPPRAWELTLRFGGDPIETLVLLGRIRPDEVAGLNYAAMVQYAPTVVLTAELHNRATTTKREYPHIKLQKLRAELDAVG